jgi:hypothetical protein
MDLVGNVFCGTSSFATVVVIHEYPRASLSEAESHTPTNASATASNYGDLAVQSVHGRPNLRAADY